MKCYFVPWCLSVILWITLEISITDARQLYSPAKDFNRHRIVQPTLHHGRTKREISSTKDTNGAHHGQVMIKVNIDGEEYVLDLRMNDELVTDNHVVGFQKDGETVIHRPSREELDICQYSGTVRGKRNSWVAVSTCHGVRGVIYDGEHFRYIEPRGDKIQSDHYVYDHKDLKTNFNCGYKGGVTNNTDYDPVLMKEHQEEKARKRSRAGRYKRNTEDTQVRGPYNANKLTRYVELVLVVDNREYIENNQDRDLVHHQLKDIANIINAVYAPLNIFIALVGVVIWTERDEISLEENGDNTLNNFLHYRKTVLSTKIPNDNAHLLTRQKFHDGVVGKALKGPICTYEFSGGVATNHSMVIGLVATTIAHEMGHNFGMEHDTAEDCECPDEKCIMSPSSTSVMPIHWSSCSLKSLALSFEKGMDYCLKNKPARLYESPTCGNGFVEPGEQCDCGLLIDPKAYSKCTQCCHNDNCMLRRNATCAAGECCDFETCRPKRGGTVCRSASRECDLPEYCTGHSEYCPADVYKMDAEPCGAKGEAYCVKGSCRTHRDQCQLLWGPTGENSDGQCYAMNDKGDESGNCGYNRLSKTYKQCKHEDVLCGLLQCKHLNERLEFGMESVATVAHRFINNKGSIIPCRTAIIDLGLSDVDPGLVPDGAKCGYNKMCMQQRCVPVSQVRAAISQLETSVCPSNCSGHGVCNSNGHCHCEIGFGGTLCDMPGPGGSIESGPATDPSVQRNFMVAMFIIFLGVIPLIVLIMFLLYYSRYNVLSCMKKPKKSLQSPKKSSLQRLSQGVSKFAANFHNNAPSSQPVNIQTPSSPDEMSSSLLRSDSDRTPTGNINNSINIFGNFNGFSLNPIDKNPPKEEPTVNNEKPKETVASKSAKITPVHRSSSNSQNLITQGVLKPVLRSAPPLPIVPNTGKVSPKSSPLAKRNNSTVQNRIKALMNVEKTEELHPVSTNPPPRPVISSPILEASTCTAKELISPLQGSKTLKPVRAAPTLPPTDAKRPLSMHTEIPQKPLPDEPKKVKEGISLNRIASFLKHEKPKEKERNAVERSLSLPKSHNQVKVPLRNLEISNPILQKNIELSVSTVPVVSDTEDEDSKPINRTQSMRSPSSQKPVLQSFGSMRQAPSAPRPASVVGRPSAPPPPLPNTLYQNTKPEINPNDYVDCIEEKLAPLAHIDEESGDNIYAVIEESPVRSKPLPGVPPPIKTIPQAPPEGYKTPRPITSNSGSTESMGLLGEIVNEIQHRNFDSIYSTATLARKRKERERLEKEKRESTSTNAESVYSNSGAKSNVSTTSSGYLHPSAVNVPTYMNKDTNSNQAIKIEPEKTPPSPKGPNSKIPTFARQVTPPGLKSTTSFKNVASSPKNVTKNTPKIANSPDLVSSCSVADTKNVKPPDVVNNNKTAEVPKVSMKPNVTPKPIDNRPPLKPTPSEKRSTTVKSTPALKPVNSAANIKSQMEKNPPVNRANSKVDSNVKAIADNLNKNKPKVVPKPSSSVANINKNDTNVNKPLATTKLVSKNSNVASLQQKFENRKSFGKDTIVKK